LNEELDIAIEVRFLSDLGVPAGLVNDIIREIAWAVREAEQEELDAIFENFSELPPLVRDAMRYRFEQIERDHALNIEYGGRGSLLLFATAAGLAYWVADKTLGETVREAWVESALHARLKDFLKSRVLHKRDRLLERLPGARYRPPGVTEVMVRTENEPTPRVVLEVQPDEGGRIPRPSEIASARDGEPEPVPRG